MEPSVGCPGVRHDISLNADARERVFVQRHSNQRRCAHRGAWPLAGAGYPNIGPLAISAGFETRGPVRRIRAHEEQWGGRKGKKGGRLMSYDT